MANKTVSWNRIITVGSVFGIPMVSLAFAAVVLITKMDDKLVNLQLKQQEQGADIKDIKDDAKSLRVLVDSVAQRQKDYQRENEYKWWLQESKKK